MSEIYRGEVKPFVKLFVKLCEDVVLYKPDFYDYAVPRLNKMKKTDRALLIISETGTYLAIDKDFKSRDDWDFYLNVIEKSQEFLYINFNDGEPSLIRITKESKESAVDLINDFYIQHLQRAILAYSKAKVTLKEYF